MQRKRRTISVNKPSTIGLDWIWWMDTANFIANLTIYYYYYYLRGWLLQSAQKHIFVAVAGLCYNVILICIP